MKLLLDQGLPRGAAQRLRQLGEDAIHVGEASLSGASDTEIIAFAAAEGRVVVTLDADFHMILALSGALKPSIVRIRIEGLQSEALSKLLQDVLQKCGPDLDVGAIATVTSRRIRLRRLPIR